MRPNSSLLAVGIALVGVTLPLAAFAQTGEELHPPAPAQAGNPAAAASPAAPAESPAAPAAAAAPAPAPPPAAAPATPPAAVSAPTASPPTAPAPTTAPPAAASSAPPPPAATPSSPPPAQPPPGAYPRSIPPPPRSGPPPLYYAYRYVDPWGWGYYPVYPPAPRAPAPPPPPAAAAPPSETDSVNSWLALYGAGNGNGYMAGASLGVDTRWVGLDVSVDALADEKVTGPTQHDPGSPAAWGTAHITWSIVSIPRLRIRVLTGGSMLALPKSEFTAGQPWAGKTLWGPDVGVSGGINLIGAVAVEGYAHLTPFPTRVGDAYAGATLRFGPIGLMGGWRWVEVYGDGNDAPRMSFSGPEAGLAIRF